MTRKNKFTLKQQRFVDEFLIDLNATQAAIRAGYSAKRADAIAYKLLRNAEIQEAISVKRGEIADNLQITRERIVTEMARLAFVDCRKFFEADGTPIPVHQLSDDAAAAIIGLDVVTVGNAEIGVGQVLKYKIPDKNKALENLARILGYFEKDNKQKTPIVAIDLNKFFNDVLRKPANEEAS